MNFTLDEQDKALFRQQLDPVMPERHRPKCPITIHDQWPEETEHRGLLDQPQVGDVTATEVLCFARHGLSKRLIRKLSRGKLEIDAAMDFHHFTISEVDQALPRFLNFCHTQQHRVAKLVHGKGQHNQHAPCPVIKNHLNRYLRRHQRVLAFHSALPKHGGAGALYVLLKL